MISEQPTGHFRWLVQGGQPPVLQWEWRITDWGVMPFTSTFEWREVPTVTLP